MSAAASAAGLVAPARSSRSRAPRTLEILYRDERLAAVNKPSGLIVHKSARASDHDNCLTRLRAQLGRHVHPLHRLDRGASGVLVFALDPDAARVLHTAFAERRVHKAYLAVVRGFPQERGTIERALRDEAGRECEARTHFRRLAQVELPHAVGRYASARYALVLAEPESGREHQIRRHLRSLDHPLLGDSNYGDGAHNRFFRARFGSSRLVLHAAAWRLSHPEGGRELEIRAPLPAELVALFGELGFLDALPPGLLPVAG